MGTEKFQQDQLLRAPVEDSRVYNGARGLSRIPGHWVGALRTGRHWFWRFRIRIGGAMALSATVLAFGVAPHRTPAADGIQGRLGSAARAFPLWSQLPSRFFAVLGEGSIHSRRWGVYAYRGSGRNGGQRPCIELVTLRQLSGGLDVANAGPECGTVAPPPKHLPLVAWSSFGAVDSSVIGIAAGLSVTSVQLSVSGGAERVLGTQILSPAQARKANVRQFRFVATPLPVAGCIESLEGFGASGEVSFQMPRHGCRVSKG
jgi:hypothetical protein